MTVREMRVKMNITQKQVGDVLGITQSHYGQIERKGNNLSDEKKDEIIKALQAIGKQPWKKTARCAKPPKSENQSLHQKIIITKNYEIVHSTVVEKTQKIDNLKRIYPTPFFSWNIRNCNY